MHSGETSTCFMPPNLVCCERKNGKPSGMEEARAGGTQRIFEAEIHFPIMVQIEGDRPVRCDGPVSRRVDNLALGWRGHRQHTDTRCACRKCVHSELSVKRIGNADCLAGPGSADHISSSQMVDYQPAWIERQPRLPQVT
jgi:hypothetical protein